VRKIGTGGRTWKSQKSKTLRTRSDSNKSAKSYETGYRVLLSFEEGIMTRVLLSLLSLALASGAMAEPMKLTGAQMDSVTAGKIQEVFIETQNPAGKTPPGQQNPDPSCNACTVVTENQNPAGHPPPGQN
jgi:hypothetical protein